MDMGIGIGIGVIILFFLLDGIRRGLFRSIFEIVGLIAAFVCAYYYGHTIAAVLARSLNVSHAALLYFFSFVVFIAILAVFSIIGHVIQKLVSATPLGPLDRAGGAVFGAIKGVLIASLLLVILEWLPLPRAFKDRVRENPVAAEVAPLLPNTYRLLIRNAPLKPDEAIDRMEERIEDSQETRRERTA